MSETLHVSTEAGRPTKDVLRDLNAAIYGQGLEFGVYDFGNDYTKNWEKWPSNYIWVACYPVVGVVDGYYIHIDLVSDGFEATRRPVFIAKTWTWESAYAIANAAAKLLDRMSQYPRNQQD